MALFDNDEEQKTGDTEQFWGDQYSNIGNDDLVGGALAVSYLSMVQPGSSAASEHEPGTWRNTANNKNYGNTVVVVPLAFKMLWVERERDYPYFTVNRYAPHSIPVTIQKPKPGTRGFPDIINPETGNKIQELPIYAVLLPESPEDGVLYFSPTIGSLRTCKTWNNLLRSSRTPSGKQAAIFQYQWILGLDLVQNPKKPNDPKELICKFSSVKRGPMVGKELAVSQIIPYIETPPDIKQLMAPEYSGDAE